MKLKEIYNAIDRIAPFALSDEYCKAYNGYDNSGIILDCGKEISSALFSLDCSRAAVEQAKALGMQAIITHHPAIYAPLKCFTAENPLTECAKCGISVISAHLNLDCAKGGIDDSLALVAGGSSKRKMHSLSSGGYGSVFELDREVPLGEYCKRLEGALNTRRIVCYGTRPVKRVASFCGGGMDEESVSYAKEQGADTFISSDPKHHLITSLVEAGLNVVIVTHYAAENYGFEKFYQKIKEKLTGVRTQYFTDERLL